MFTKTVLAYQHSQADASGTIIKKNTMGILKIKGTIDLSQFWPSGGSDADTTKIQLSVTGDSFSFSADVNSGFLPTRAFEGASVRGTSRREVVKNNRITVRLQGIDAPELHYRAPALRRSDDISAEQRETYNRLNRKFRQYMGETATVGLSAFLQTTGDSPVACEFTTQVDFPYEVIDTYGRFVGNISVRKGGVAVDINTWLAEEGWVYPAFYTSMTAGEIGTLTEAARRGKTKGRLWQHYSDALTRFKYELQYRGEDAVPDENADKGPVLFPKLFRRQVAWILGKRAGIWGGGMKTYLARNREQLYKTNEFLEQTIHTAPAYYLHEFVTNNRFTPKPEEVVFKEKFSTLVNELGEEINQW